MALLTYYRDRLDTLLGTGAFGPSASSAVVLYRAGAQVNGNFTGTAIPVVAGHGFPAAYTGKVIAMRRSGGVWSMVASSYRTVSSTLVTTVTVGASITLLDGDFLIQLGSDAGVSTPLYTASAAVISPTSDSSDAPITNSTPAVNAQGEYEWWTAEGNLWALILSAGVPSELRVTATPALPGGLQTFYAVRYAHLFATAGSGTAADPWTVSGSNPVQAALNDLPAGGGTVYMVPGYYSLGSATNAISIPILTTGVQRTTYVFEGAGRDLVFLRYSGSGSAFRYPQVNTGTPGSSYQSNQLEFRGFSIGQVGTPRTGNAFYFTYCNSVIWESLNVGGLKQDAGAGEPDEGFEYGIRLDGTPGDNVTDFNRVVGCQFKCNKHAIYGQNQCDNMRIERCDFEPNQLSADNQDGVEITNSNGVSIEACHFNYFGKRSNNSAFGAVRFSAAMNGCSVRSCYFEGNYPYSVDAQADQDQGGIDISGNSFSFNAITNAVGVRIGQDIGGSPTFHVSGVRIAANTFQALSATNVGVMIRDEVRGFLLGPNRYMNTGGTDRILQRGCRGVIMELLDETNFQPYLWLMEALQFGGRILLENTNASSQESPRVQFRPGGSGARLTASLAVQADGTFTVINDAGSGKFSVDQSGNAAVLGTLAATGAVTENSNGSLAGASGSTWVRGYAEENLVLSTSGTTTDTAANLLPAGAIILGVVARVTTTIATATDWKLGDGTTAARFCPAQSGGQLTSGATVVGLDHMNGNVTTTAAGPTQAAAAKVRVTTTGTPSAGRIRIGVHYMQFTAPTS